jgi:GTP-binding protein EngB required for normal cell division
LPGPRPRALPYARPARLADVIGRFVGKVEIALAGADEAFRAGQEALADGDAMGARAAAHLVLDQAPGSLLGLALLADACESAHLDAELALTLEELARRAPARAEVWLRLARARRTTSAPPAEVSDALVRALAAAESGSDERIDALVGLADMDLARGDGARAELWLERAAPGPSGPSSVSLALSPETATEIAVRQAEARLLCGDASGAKARLEGLPTKATDGRAALVLGRALAMLGDPAAFGSLVRAMVLDMPGAPEALASALGHLPSDPQTRTRIRSVVDAKGEQGLTRWRAAFARADGAREDARRALREALAAGDAAAARPLLDAAIEDRDPDALEASLKAIPRDDSDPLLRDARRFVEAFPVSPDRGALVLDALTPITHSRLLPWAAAIAGEVTGAWIPASGTPATWPSLLARLDAHAHAVGDLEAATHVGDVSAERSRPVRLAVVGEFNAGKSTLINALIGADVAPTGVLPTTATLHHLRWAPDPFAKILFVEGHEPPERIVPLGHLREALANLDASLVRRVELRMPLATLVSVEILDTPGFNAPDAGHARVARSAFEEADIALWLMDATQAMKESERAVLKDARLPVQILVNKADRLSPADLARVMENVVGALAATDVGAWGPPLALSAKKALAAKLAKDGTPGEQQLLVESGWPAVQALLEDRIVGRSAELKERALRRRTSRITAELIEAWTRRDAEDRADAERRATSAHAAAQAAARMERDAEVLTERLTASLVGQALEWQADLDLVFVGRDRHAAAHDPVLVRYRIDRAVAAIAPTLSRSMAAMVSEVGIPPVEMAPSARAIVRAAAGCTPVEAVGTGAQPPTEADAMLTSIARAAVATLADQLFAASLAPLPPTRAAGVLRELMAFAVAIES